MIAYIGAISKRMTSVYNWRSKLKIKKLFIFFVLALCLFAVSLVPSSNLLDEAKERYLNHNEDDDLSFSHFDFFLSTAYAEDTFGSGVAIPIPLEDEMGRPANPANFTENSYEDPTIKVRIEKGEYKDAVYHVAYVEVADPSQLRTAISGKITGSKTVRVSDIAPKLNAIVAMNGDFYTQLNVGYVVRQGVEIRRKVSNTLDILMIDDQGDFHIVTSRGKEQGEDIKALQANHEIVNSFVFGPALVVDGQVQKISDDYQFAMKYKNPRAAIAQIDKLSYAMIMVEGRNNDSKGVTGAELAEICANLNVKHAYNLDGGNSAILYFKDDLLISRSKENERFVSDIIYFSSAVVE